VALCFCAAGLWAGRAGGIVGSKREYLGFYAAALLAEFVRMRMRLLLRPCGGVPDMTCVDVLRIARFNAMRL